MLAVFLIVLAIPASAFLVHTELTFTGRIAPGVTFVLPIGHANLLFASNISFSSLSMNETFLTINGIGFGVNRTGLPFLNITITKWATGPISIIGGSVIEFTVSTFMGSVTFYLKASGGTYKLVIDGNDVTARSGFDVGDLHTSSWTATAGMHTFAWVLSKDTSIVNAILYGPWVFGFILIMALILAGAWWVKSRGRSR